MDEQNEDDEVIVDGIARSLDLRYPVKLSAELSALLKPNEFLSGLGIHFSDRVKTILGTLKEGLIPNRSGQEDTVPKEGINIPLALTKGPFIKEEVISIRAEVMDDEGEAVILLTSILK